MIHRKLQWDAKPLNLSELSVNFLKSPPDKLLPFVAVFLHILHSERHLKDGIMKCLLREATAINSNVDDESVRKVVDVGAVSWEMIEDQPEEVVMGRLRAINDLDESQCNKLYHKMESDRRKYREIVKSFYISWFMKCMYSVSATFQC